MCVCVCVNVHLCACMHRYVYYVCENANNVIPTATHCSAMACYSGHHPPLPCVSNSPLSRYVREVQDSCALPLHVALSGPAGEREGGKNLSTCAISSFTKKTIM